MKSPARIFISVRPSNPRRLSTKRFAINDVVYRSARRAFKDVNEKTNLKLLRNRSTVDGIGYGTVLLARARLDRASPIPPPQSAEGPRAPTDRPLTRIWCQPRSPTRTRDVRRVAPCRKAQPRPDDRDPSTEHGACDRAPARDPVHRSIHTIGCTMALATASKESSSRPQRAPPPPVPHAGDTHSGVLGGSLGRPPYYRSPALLQHCTLTTIVRWLPWSSCAP